MIFSFNEDAMVCISLNEGNFKLYSVIFYNTEIIDRVGPLMQPLAGIFLLREKHVPL